MLFPAFAAVTSLKGVGPRLSPLLERLAGGRLIDLGWHLPIAVIDRRIAADVQMLRPGDTATLALTIDEHAAAANPRAPYRVFCHDQAGHPVQLVFFSTHGEYLARQLPVGATRLVSGAIDFFAGTPQIAHPDYIVAPERAADIPAFEPVYRLTQGMTNKRLTPLIATALARLPELPEWLDPSYRARQGWPAWRDALVALHHPQGPLDAAPDHPARRRLAYDELFANQLALALVRDRMKKRPGRRVKGDGRLRTPMLAALPFTPTGAQSRTIAEIVADMGSDAAMLRLLQGDVGSGKTLVALAAMLNAVEAGGQAALLAPTEILARQHFATLGDLCPPGVEIALLTGRDKGKKRASLLDRLRDGGIDILIATHALFQEDVEFHDLLLAVVDEQHRFGVHQRLGLAAKRRDDRRLDMLVMTATPIPRTLTLAHYGEMDVSKLDEKPPGRIPVDTRVVALERIDEVVAGLARAIGQGEQAYWVCPLIDDHEASELAAAQTRFDQLKPVFGDRVALVHGRMKPAEKDAAMAAFVAGEIAILVATTVIEVGVDVPGATIMVIEQAERFGLAQLHQLRGRVGRGGGRATCLLLRGRHLGETARARLQIMRETEDGFRIAEEDLKLRGTGELLGTKQSGLPEFRLVDLDHHGDLLATAQDDARLLVAQDAGLAGPRGKAARILLYLFERDAAVGLLRSG